MKIDWAAVGISGLLAFAIVAPIVDGFWTQRQEKIAEETAKHEHALIKSQELDRVQVDLSACFEELSKKGVRGCAPVTIQCEESYKGELFGKVSACLKNRHNQRTVQAKE